MSEQSIWAKIFPFSIWAVVKVGLLIALGVYFLFALVMLRQITMMIKVVSSEFNWLIRLFAWAHLLLSLAIFFFALVVL